MPYTYLSLKTDLDDVTAAAAMDLTNRSNSCAVAVGNLIGSGARRRFLKVTQGEVDATGTVTFSSVVAGDTVTIGGVVFTADATPTGDAEFLAPASGASATTDKAAAASLAALVNDDLSPIASLSNVAGTAIVNVTAYPGTGEAGNFITIAISAHGSVSGSGKLTNGDNGTTTDVPLGLAE